MSEEKLNQEQISQESSNKQEPSEQNSEIKNQSNDNFKHRLERAKDQGVKQVLSELGVTSIDEVK